jgi:hypothetical protein
MYRACLDNHTKKWSITMRETHLENLSYVEVQDYLSERMFQKFYSMPNDVEKKTNIYKIKPKIFRRKRPYFVLVSHIIDTPLLFSILLLSNTSRIFSELDPDGRVLSHPFHHQSAHGRINHGFTGCRKLFIILAQPS